MTRRQSGGCRSRPGIRRWVSIVKTYSIRRMNGRMTKIVAITSRRSLNANAYREPIAYGAGTIAKIHRAPTPTSLKLFKIHRLISTTGIDFNFLVGLFQ